MGGLGTFLVGLAGPVIRKMMLSLGIGVVSYAAMTAAITSALGSAKAALTGFTGDALAIVQMTGCFTALSIVAGALIARVSLLAIKRLEVLK
jgi:hypothetical protein